MGQKGQAKLKILAVDYSSTNTGYAVFENKKLSSYGCVKSRSLKAYKGYPFGTLRKLEWLANELKILIDQIKPDIIVIEEINRSKARMSQKTLDAGHYIFIQKIPDYEGQVVYMDSDGKEGWRSVLGLKFTDEDKKYNRTCTKKNKKRKVNRKDLAERWVNKKWKTNFKVSENKTDEDIVDAIGLGSAFVQKEGK